jgi:outer membrane protein assembly factor BamB
MRAMTVRLTETLGQQARVPRSRRLLRPRTGAPARAASLLLGLWFAAPTSASEARDLAFKLEPVPPTAGAKIEDLLRGYTAEELSVAERVLPASPEPPVPAPIARQVSVTGRVFVDRNGNRAPDPGEPGLADVCVTEGETVVRTDADGRFRLSFAIDAEPHHRFVAVTRPSGFRPAGPEFLRILCSETATSYRAEFGFMPDAPAARDDFWFLSTSDSQFSDPGAMIAIAKDYAQMTGAPDGPAFLVTAGDLTMTGSHREWDMYDYIRGAARIHVYDGFGGHDGNARRSTISYEERIGPPYYSWKYGGVHFVQLITETGYFKPRARARQAAWLEADLRSVPSGTPVVMIAHTPLGAEWFDRRRAEGVNIVGQVAGHFHAVQAGSRAGVPVLMSGPARGRDWGAYTNTYCRIRIAQGKVTSELRVAGQYQRLECLAPAAETLPGRQPLVVLAYDSARNVARLHAEIVSPAGTRHAVALERAGGWSWHGSFTPDMRGEWRIELEATDSAGAKWGETRRVRVTGGARSEPRPDTDLPWILAGTPARRASAGPMPPLDPLWVKPTGSVHVLHASPVVSGGRVYVAITNPNAGAPGSGVLCVDAKNGRELWRAPSPRGDIRGPVTVHDGRVHAVTSEGWVGCYDSDSGRELWSVPLDEKARAGRPLALSVAPPVPTGRGLLVSDWKAPQLVFDYASGRQVARLAGDTGNYAAFAIAAGGTMFSASRGSRVAIDLESGETRWKTEEAARSTSAGVVHDGSFIYTAGSFCKAVDVTNGKTRWQASVPNTGFHQPIPVVWDDLVLVNGTNFTAVDARTGEVRWTVACGREPERFLRSQRQVLAGSSTPMVAGKLAFFGHDDTSLRAVDQQGIVRWEYRLGTPVKTAPAVSGNLLFVHDYAGNLWAFAPRAPAL